MNRVNELRRMCRLFAACCALLPAGSGALFAQGQPQDRNAAAAPAGGTFRIAGTIVNAMNGAPLERARVSLTDVTNPSRRLALVTTEDGRFEFSSVPAGKFSLQGAKRGFLASTYDQHGPLSTAIVTGAGVDTEKLLLRLTPLAALSGKVVDETGEGVRNAQVTIYMRWNGEGLRQMMPTGRTETDDQGAYELGTLDPGAYFLSVIAKPWYAVHPPLHRSANDTYPSAVDPSLDVAYPVTFYDGATESDAASPIVLKGGERKQIDVHLGPVQALHVVVRFEPADTAKGFSYPVLERHVFGMNENGPTDGEVYRDEEMVELAGIPPGKYSLRSRTGMQATSQFARDINLQRGSEEIDASKVEAAGGVKLTLKQPSGEPLPPQLWVGIHDSNMQYVAGQQVDSSGLVAFPEIQAGTYSVYVGAAEGEYAVTQMSAGGQEIAGRQITLPSGADLDLTVYFSRATVSVEGFVKRDGKPVAGAMVVLVPKDVVGEADAFRRDQSDLDGSFIVRNVVPGTYSLIAIEDGWDVEWRKPNALKRYLGHGQDLTIGALMRGSVRLPEAVESVR
jgi:hypothetical protein